VSYDLWFRHEEANESYDLTGPDLDLADVPHRDLLVLRAFLQHSSSLVYAELNRRTPHVTPIPAPWG
jgi:hypothetical protein